MVKSNWKDTSERTDEIGQRLKKGKKRGSESKIKATIMLTCSDIDIKKKYSRMPHPHDLVLDVGE